MATGTVKQDSADIPILVCNKEASLSSVGIFFGDPKQKGSMPFDRVMPLFFFHVIVVVFVSRIFFFLLRRFKQPRIVSDVLSGLLIGRTVAYLVAFLFPDFIRSLTVKKNEDVYVTARRVWVNYVFRPENIAVMRTMASLGLMLNLFLTGVKIDPSTVLRSGRKAMVVGVTSIIIPLAVISPVALLLNDKLPIRDTRSDAKKTSADNTISMTDQQLLLFLSGSFSSTTFPAVAEILTELRLLNTELGRLSISASMINDAIAWFLLVAFTSWVQSGHKAMHALYVVVSFTSMTLFVFFVFRPWMQWIVRRTPKGGRVGEGHLFAILLCVFAVSVISDAIGASFMEGPLFMGLVVPDGPPLGTALVERMNLLATEVLTPLIFLMAGTVMDIRDMMAFGSWNWLMLLIFVAYATKMLGTMLPAAYFKTPLQNAAMLGLIMNFRGLVEVITYVTLKNGHVLRTSVFSYLILSAVLTTGVCAALVATFYDPLKSNQMVGCRTIQRLKPQSELRILLAVLNEEPVPAMVTIMEASCPNDLSPVCTYVLHLVELVGRATSSLIPHKNKKGYINPTNMDRLLNAFINYEQMKKGTIAVQPFTAISPFKTMHQDVCSLAMHKNVALIIVPYPRKDSMGITDADRAVRNIIPLVQSQAPCSVGILVHHTLRNDGLPDPAHFRYRIRVLYWGGPDDREALSYAARMAQHEGIYIRATRFSPSTKREDKERAWDDEVFSEFKINTTDNELVVVEEIVIDDMEGTISAIREIEKDYDLVIVGKMHHEASLLDEGLAEWVESPELGVVGDMLASSDFSNSLFSILVVQQYG